jgi:hypothetical protein
MATSTRSRVDKQNHGRIIAVNQWPTIGRYWTEQEQVKYNSPRVTVFFVTIDMKIGYEGSRFPNIAEMLLFETMIIEGYISGKSFKNVEEEQFWRLSAEAWNMYGPWEVPAGKHWDNQRYKNKTQFFAIGECPINYVQDCTNSKYSNSEEGTGIKSVNDDLTFLIGTTIG